MNKPNRRAPRSLADFDPAAPPAAEPKLAEPAPRVADEASEGVPLSIMISPNDRKRLKQLSLDSGKSLQQLGIHAWTLLLAEYGLPEMEPQTANRASGGRRKG